MTECVLRVRKSNTAFSSYRRGPTGYSDLPVYQWNEDFDLKGFQRDLAHFNRSESNALYENLEDSKLSDVLEDDKILHVPLSCLKLNHSVS
jgi:hypothetical protein